MRKVLLLLVACAMVISVASLSYAKDSQTVKGWVSNSKCGAKDASADGAACTEKCIKAGASPVVVTDADQKVLTVDNPESLKGHYGHHVAVTGKVDGDKIHVDNVAMVK
jgi:hypothetical protein